MERRGGYFWITSFFRRFICSEEWKRFRLILGNVVRSKKEGILVGPSSCDTKSKNRKRLDLKRAEWCRGRKVYLLVVKAAENSSINHSIEHLLYARY